MAGDAASVMDTEDVVNELMEQGLDLVTSILCRAPLQSIVDKIQAGAPVWFQDDEGISPLHAAAYTEDADLVKYLLDEGAVWNAVDNLHNSAGDVALSLNNEVCYTLIRDTGIRSEMLLTLLSRKDVQIESPLSLLLKATDDTAAGSTDTFLRSKLRYTADQHGQEICLLTLENGDEVGVMMGWERGIMQQTVAKLCDGHPNLDRGLKILNIGFGIGIIDSLFQALPSPPTEHVIIEAHPDVLQHMRKTGWYDKEGVTILEGKWQTHVEALHTSGFDVVYTDTFSEDYLELHKFFEILPELLDGPDSRFSFFHGLGATNALFYDVYTHVAEMHLADVGVDVKWSEVDVFADTRANTWGKTREYFALRHYRLPVGRMRTV